MDTQTPPADDVRRLVRSALKGAFATLDGQSGHPYASMVTVATDSDGTPLMLLSKLALHTKNLAADPRASLLVDATSPTGDPLAGARVTVIGRVEPADEPRARRRFLARHALAEAYAGFPDFAFYALVPERAHFIGGFGRIVGLPREDLIVDLAGAESLLDAETDIVAHMNADHAAAVELYATELCGAPSGAWRMTGIDPEGCDIATDGDVRRVVFGRRVNSPDEARKELVALVAAARARRGQA